MSMHMNNDGEMPDSLSYNDALTILGRTRSQLVAVLDAAATAGLFAWAGGSLAAGVDPSAPLALMELKNEIVRYGHDIVRKVTERRNGLSRFDRSQRLVAAHAVIAISSYFIELDGADLSVSSEQLCFSATDEVAFATDSPLPANYAALIKILLEESIPLPEPHRLYADVCGEIHRFYNRLSARVWNLINSLAVWDMLTTYQHNQIKDMINRLPDQALARYRNSYRDLAVDNHEFEVWTSLTAVNAVGASLSRITALLTKMAPQGPGPRARVHLARIYQAVLDEPVAGAVQALGGIRLPSLADAYVNPQCRVAEIRQGDRPAVSEWWNEREVISDVEAFLAGYLTSLRATNNPLVVLGEPGSGKSKLTEVLAARLPDQDFLPILVQLRDVAAQSMIQQQIEQAIYRGPGDQLNWHDLLDGAGQALPVVLLDGFDELVQAAAINRYDYLEMVQDFQRRQFHLGHPVAVIVTSRIVVADHVRFPPGTLALQLQPFDEIRVRQWLDVWADHNTAVLARRGLQPLSAENALAHGELAQQPLLLMMLAIFDTTGNTLQRADTRIGRAELYERLLRDFALREIAKSAHNRSLPTDKQLELADNEIRRLATIALAMFVRGRQVITEIELNRDMTVFSDGSAQSPDESNTPSLAQRAVSGFFFIHKSEARSDAGQVRSYEFLHATFAEFLVARTIISELHSIAVLREALQRAPSALSNRVDDGLLFAILSFSCLAGRSAIIDFLGELFKSIPEESRSQFKDVLSGVLAGSLYTHANRSFQEYEPVRHTFTRRLAVYSANLTLILVSLLEALETSTLFGESEAAEVWSQYAHLWRGGLTGPEWRGLLKVIRARVFVKDGRIDIRLTTEDGSPVAPADSFIIADDPPDHEVTHHDLILSKDDAISYAAEIHSTTTAGRVFRNAAFLADWHTGLILLQSVPALMALNGEARWQSKDGTSVLPTYLFGILDYLDDESMEKRVEVYELCVSRMAGNPQVHRQLMRRLLREISYLPSGVIIDLLDRCYSSPPTKETVAIINLLWRNSDNAGTRQAIIELIRDIRNAGGDLPGLDDSINSRVDPGTDDDLE